MLKEKANPILVHAKQRVRQFMRMSALNGMPLSPNDRALLAFDGIHHGERCFIIGMGPSLKVADLGRLKNEVTFACNKVYLSFGETEWRPTYYSVIDDLVLEQNLDEIEAVNCPKFFPRRFRNRVRGNTNQQKSVVFYEYTARINQGQGKEVGFNHRLVQGILSEGASVLIDQIQIAFAMGFDEVILLGLDFSFAVPKEAVTQDHSASGAVLKSVGEVNHFHKDYRKPGERWTVPRMDAQEIAFEFARDAFDAAGRRLVNASRETRLDAIERVDFDDLF